MIDITIQEYFVEKNGVKLNLITMAKDIDSICRDYGYKRIKYLNSCTDAEYRVCKE